MQKIRKVLIKFLCKYGEHSARLPSHHGNSEPKIPDVLKKRK